MTSPAANAAETGAEPGFVLAVTGTASATASNGLTDDELLPRVALFVDDRPFAVALGSDGTWTAQARIYRGGTVPIVATATASLQGSTATSSFNTQVQVSLVSESPTLVVNAPASGFQVRLGENGADVPVLVTMADATQFGDHTVVVQPDRGDAVTLAHTPGSTTQFSGTVHLNPMPLGARGLSVTGACRAAPGANRTLSVAGVGVDIDPPHITVSHPRTASGQVAAQASAADPTAFTVSVSGTSVDPQSGMVGGQAGVGVALNAQDARVAARPARPGDWTTWTVDALPLPKLPVPPPAAVVSLGTFPLLVWATDNAGNTTPDPFAWSFEAIKAWVPATLDERLSPLEYLRDLVHFTGTQATAATPVPPPLHPIRLPVSPTLLATVLAQPIDAISQPATPAAAAGQLPVNELRVPIEVLRTHMSAQHLTPSAAGESAYLSVAYQTLLAGLGTSYAELRVARGAQPSDRAALAARLGISLYGLAATGAPDAAPADRPDQLDALTLDGPTLTEQALADLFGLPSTAPFDSQHVPPSSDPRVLTWQLEALRAVWRTQDAHPLAPVTYSVLVDPDVITAADVRADSPQSKQVTDLLAARAAQLSQQGTTLTAARVAAAMAADGGLAALLAAGLPAGVDLGTLSTLDSQGADIRLELAAAGLDRTGFLYLRQLQRLASSGGALVTASEWADAVDVLVGAYRRRQYAAWTTPDPATGSTAEAGLVLSPDAFQISDNAPLAGPLRVDPNARRDWQSTLRTRTIERNALQAGSLGLVAAVERSALPVLRDGLLVDIAGPQGDPAAIGEQMTRRYQIDVLVSGALTTTRLQQAITTLQTLLLLIRSGDYAQIDPFSSWLPTSANAAFDSAWSWIGTFSGWRSATTTFLFPEAALDPSLLAGGTSAKGSLVSNAFQKLCDALSVGPGLDVSGPIADYVKGQPGATPPVVGARQLLQQAVGTAAQSFDYPKTRSAAAQAQLVALSGMLDGSVPNPNGGATSPNLALEVFWAVPMLVGERLHADGHYQAALDWLWIVLPYTDANPVSAYDVVNNEIATDAPQPDLSLTDWTTFDPFALIAGRPYPHLRSTLLEIIRCLLDYADSEFATETDESIAHARNLYRSALQLLEHPRFKPVVPSNPGEAALPIPQLAVLQARAANQLAKLRQDRNVAGLPRTQVVSSGDPIRQPTPYHFKVLLARAQQLAQQATSLEAAYLSALEKYDSRTLQFADAQNAASLAAAQVVVHDAQVQQATDAVSAAQAQVTRAQATVATYTDAINAPPNRYESALLDNYRDMSIAQDFVAAADATVGIAQAAAGAAGSWGVSLTEIGGIAVRAAAQVSANEISRQMQANQLQASIEDRKQQWQIELASAQQDALVAAAQVATARDQAVIATSERAVANLQSDQARSSLDLLQSQFTSPGMYRWLSDTLGGVYRSFLQQATATATLAQTQLAFERAEPARAFIRGDYWQPLSAPPGGDARGLTGAERLTDDLSRLDQYAFSTDSRRLNISQTFSIAAVAPVEFLDFRATGQISFMTPTALFDQDFPGHYQRLIRQVRLSVVALVPPSRGIRATLASYGISRVTTANDGLFTEVLLRRDPSVVALTSPVEATGVFTVDVQPDMLLPFEGSGVDTTWQLTLPVAANPFDFRTISDVLLTIDYQALVDLDYRAQVIRRLNADLSRSGDRVFSLVRDFPDQWYTLNNPDPSSRGRSATITLGAADFPPNLSAVTTAQIAVRLSGAGPFPQVPITLTHGSATGTADCDPSGTASTRRGGAAWIQQLVGSTPLGDWHIAFDSTAEPLFAAGGLDDVLLVIGWTGQGPAWLT